MGGGAFESLGRNFALALAPARRRPVQVQRGPRQSLSPGFIGGVLQVEAGLAILVILMFPQLVALCWALVVKLIIRGAWALITQVCQLMQQIMADAAEIGEGLIMWLSQQLGVVQQPATPLCLVLDKQPCSSASATCDPPFDLSAVRAEPPS